MVPTKADNPSLPVTPEEIAEDARRCYELGASILHLHARDGEGRPTYRKEAYAQIVAKVRERCPQAIVCVSTSGRVFKTFEERSQVLDLDGDLKPEMASLTLGSLNFPRQASVNEPEMIRRLAERMKERGIVPELEVFDWGMVDYARYLIERGLLEPPFDFGAVSA
jgi:3-keto-5-aminohexanoate cleavage enzyme